MKKLLILAYDFPPYVSVGGLRPYNWYTQLKKFDIYPIVVTRQWSYKHGNGLDYIESSKIEKTIEDITEFGTIIKTAYKPNLSNRLLLKYGDKKYVITRKFITAFYEYAQFIVPIGPKINLYFEAQKYLENNQVDCIIATGEPFILFKYAAKLGKQFNTPFVLDYRDPWSQDHRVTCNFFKRKWNTFFEKSVLAKTHTVTTTIDYFKNMISENISKSKIKLIQNGYDSELIKSTRQIKQNSETFSITFVGTLQKYNPLKTFLKVFDEFSSNKPNVRLEFIGTKYSVNNLKKLSDHTKSKISFLPRMSNLNTLKKISESNVLLLFNYYSNVGTKIYDYLAVKRKILFCYSNDIESIKLKKKYYNYGNLYCSEIDEQIKIIEETNSGIIVKNKTKLLHELNTLYWEFQLNGYIECNSINIEQYSRKRSTEKLAKILDQL